MVYSGKINKNNNVIDFTEVDKGNEGERELRDSVIGSEIKRIELNTKTAMSIQGSEYYSIKGGTGNDILVDGIHMEGGAGNDIFLLNGSNDKSLYKTQYYIDDYTNSTDKNLKKALGTDKLVVKEGNKILGGGYNGETLLLRVGNTTTGEESNYCLAGSEAIKNVTIVENGVTYTMNLTTATTVTANSNYLGKAHGVVNNIDASSAKKGLVLEAGAWNENTIQGSTGNDTLVGNGKTKLTGNKGNDVFLVSSGDTVVDYESKDKIVLSEPKFLNSPTSLNVKQIFVDNLSSPGVHYYLQPNPLVTIIDGKITNVTGGGGNGLSNIKGLGTEKVEYEYSSWAISNVKGSVEYKNSNGKPNLIVTFNDLPSYVRDSGFINMDCVDKDGDDIVDTVISTFTIQGRKVEVAAELFHSDIGSYPRNSLSNVKYVRLDDGKKFTKDEYYLGSTYNGIRDVITNYVKFKE